MKLISTILFSLSINICSGQYPADHLKLLESLEIHVPQGWEIDQGVDNLDVTDYFELPHIDISLFNDTSMQDSITAGVGIYLFSKEFRDSTLYYDWTEGGFNGIISMETKSYIVVIEWATWFNEKYAASLTALLPRLQKFFITHRDAL